MTSEAKAIRDRLRLVSHFAGRVRVRADTFRVLPEVGSAVSAEVAAIDGVTESTCTPTTGSLLVRYDPSKVQLPRLMAVIVRAGGLHGLALVPDEANEEPRLGARVRETLDAADRRVWSATGRKLDLRTVVPAALIGTGAAFLLAGAGRRRVPEWYDLVFWGFVTFCNVNPGAPAPAAASRSDEHAE